MYYILKETENSFSTDLVDEVNDSVEWLSWLETNRERCLVSKTSLGSGRWLVTTFVGSSEHSLYQTVVHTSHPENSTHSEFRVLRTYPSRLMATNGHLLSVIELSGGVPSAQTYGQEKNHGGTVSVDCDEVANDMNVNDDYITENTPEVPHAYEPVKIKKVSEYYLKNATGKWNFGYWNNKKNKWEHMEREGNTWNEKIQ